VGRTYERVEEQQYSAFTLKLPTDWPMALYARQSQKDGPIKHKESYELQTRRLVEYAQELGWSEQQITVLIENKRKDGQWRRASATLRIDQRPGLQTLVNLIESDQIKVVLVWAVDRLFRHEDMVEPAAFVRLCKEHGVVILTMDDYFDFNNPKRDDRRRFLAFAQQAADYIDKHILKRMIPAKNQVSRRGDYDGRIASVGLIWLEGNPKPQEYLPQAKVVRSLFQRFRELDGRFNLLWNEVAYQSDLFPPYPSEAPSVPGFRKEEAFGISRYGLKHLLMNPIYIGWWYFREHGKPTLLKENNHEAIVDEEDFWYAFNLLSKKTMDGEDNPECLWQPPVRYTQPETVPSEALLRGIIISPAEKSGVYVQENSKEPDKAYYRVTHAHAAAPYSEKAASILVRHLDALFEEKLIERLRISQAFDALLAKQGNRGKEQSMYQYLLAVQSMVVKKQQVSDGQLEEYRAEAISLDRTLHYGAAALDSETIEVYAARLAKLRRVIGILEDKQRETPPSTEQLRENASLLVEASECYEGMTFERKQKLIRLVTSSIALSVLAPRWLVFEIQWSPFLGVLVHDQAYIWRPSVSGSPWSEEEKAIVQQYYETEEADTLLALLPRRGWGAIVGQGERQHLYRSLRQSRPAHEKMCNGDFEVLTELGLLEDLEQYPDRRLWWVAWPVDAPANVNNVASPG